MAPSTINLLKRFGMVVEPNITKARKGRGKPNLPGGDWKAWNAGNPLHPKDARGRWTDNPVGQAIGQAYANVSARTGSRSALISDVRTEIGGAFTRDEIDAELLRLEGGDAGGDVALLRHYGPHLLSEGQRAGGLRVGEQDRHLLEIRGSLPAPGPVTSVRPEGGRWVDNPVGQAIAQAFSNIRDRHPDRIVDPEPSTGRDPKQQTIGLLKDLGADTYDDWDDSDLAELRAHAATLIAAVDGEQKRRKAAKPKRATARLTAKPDLDYDTMAAEMRALPLVPESADLIRERLGKLTIPQLRALGATIDHPLPSKARKAELASALEERLIGSRLTTDAVMNYGDTGRFDRRRAEAGTSNLERLMGGKWQKPAAPDQKPERFNPTTVTTGLHLEDEDTARARLEALTIGQLREVGDELNLPRRPKDRADLIRAIINFTVNDGRNDPEGRHSRNTPRASESVAPKPRTRRTSEGNDLAAMRNVLERMRHDELKQEIMALENDTDGVEKAKARLASMKVDELKAFAATLGDTVPKKGTKPQLISGIVEGTIGFRQRARAINAQGFARREGGGDVSASLRHAEGQLEEMRADLENLYGEDPDRWPEARQDHQVEAYWDQRERVERLRAQGKA